MKFLVETINNPIKIHHQKPIKMNTYTITYTGNDLRFKNLCIEQNANTAREAVIEFFSERLSDRFFPQDDGSIKDADGMTISESNQDYIKHDGGYFETELAQ